MDEGYGGLIDKPPEQKILKLSPQLVTPDNVSQYKGW